ncbi:DUF1538 domain-containing protein [Vibrio salinus]|uniref:DUF1538 domain-containing protein n=1 Tax=Vibrio salinus TaxID=2899784 RepID=UPI001E4BE3E9|nr:DUF1538 domain-containing protein [Vibrio salinus]MCE0492997.1 DUF1538 domain-containing protein [Vibrio salinus]
MKPIVALIKALIDSFKDLLPIVFVVLFFQMIVLKQPMPNYFHILSGVGLVIVGLTFFVFGLNMALFPIGETLAHGLANKGSVTYLLIFAFFLGFGTTIAEPALTSVADKAAEVASQGGVIASDLSAQESYSHGLRITVALAVGVAIVLGVLRILEGWPIHIMIIAGYLLVVILTIFAPASIIGIAYDSGGVTTSTITVPLVTALGVGLSSVIKGRNPMIDGFGLIAFASLLPMIFVLVYGMVIS